MYLSMTPEEPDKPSGVPMWFYYILAGTSVLSVVLLVTKR